MTECVLPGSEVTFLLADVSRLWRHAFEDALVAREIGLTPGAVRALVYVARMEGPKQRQLADAMGIEPMTVSAALDALEKAGLVRRETDPGDRRAKRIFLTPASRTVLDTVAPIAAQTYRKAIGDIDDAQTQLLAGMLERMRSNLNIA